MILERDTQIVKGLEPSARIFGVEWVDALAVMASTVVIFPVAWIVCPPLPFVFAPLVWIGVHGFTASAAFDLNPVLPGALTWVLLSLSYIKIRQDRPDGFLLDLFWEAAEGLETLFSDTNPNCWDVGRPDTTLDTYLLNTETEHQ